MESIPAITVTSTLSINKGITLTPPVIGRITMGHTIVRADGKSLPVKDDFFSLTTLFQDKRTRVWEKHPLQDTLVKANEKLRAIPVRLAYNDPNLTLHNSFSAFDQKTGRILCAGNGTKARRCAEEGVKEIDCPRPAACEFGVRQYCKNMSRAYFQVDGQGDDLGTFILRTTSFNSLNYLGSRLAALSGLTGGKLAGMPLMLVMGTKTTTQSFREPIYFADLVVRPGMTLLSAVQVAKEYQEAMTQAGLSLDGMETQMRAGLANSDFSDEIEDIDEWISDEDLVAAASAQQAARGTGLKGMDSLAANLDRIAEAHTATSTDAASPAPADEAAAA